MEYTFRYTDGNTVTVKANDEAIARDTAMRIRYGSDNDYPRGPVANPNQPWISPPYKGYGLTLLMF